MRRSSRKIVLLNFGSLGDVHPYIGMGLILQRAGWDVEVGTNHAHVDRVRSAGLKATGIGLDLSADDPKVIEIIMDPKRGPERLHRELIFPYTRQFIEDSMPLCKNANLILTGLLGYFVPTLSELTKVPWGMGMLAPLAYWSAIDPPEVSAAPFLRSLKVFGPGFMRQFYKLIFLVSKNWSRDLHKERERLGLKPQDNPLHPKMLASGAVNLAMFSEHFAKPQSDWPKDLQQIGFIDYDGPGESGTLSPEIQQFLDAGSKPVLITLGSTHVHSPGKIFEVFFDVIAHTNHRSIMLVGENNLKIFKEKFRHPRVGIFGYAPYGKLMPLCSALVHQGGIGTTGQTLRAGLPAVILGSVNDQLDNARHVENMGAGVKLPLKKLSKQRLSEAINYVSKPEVIQKTQQIGAQIRSENVEEKLLRAVEKFVNS